MDVQGKIRAIDLASMVLFLVMLSGTMLILFMDDFQLFFNPRLMAFVGVLAVLGIILMRKRQALFAQTL